ncbi:uncharacterized protein LOC113005268 [Solenopsis invicta]|uniref:uncharacterized protein LOC113005268 n=1 Tax=Solenopsis invicta TaxID=13686 RepID=UPI00193CBE97|nr:uncharacterized protein LOC113005268 [Solenopsis invicta]
MLQTSSPQLLTSALVDIRNRRGKLIRCRALLDTGATANFISENIVRHLDVRVLSHSLPIGMLNNSNTYSRGVVQIEIQSVHDKYNKALTCLTIPEIANLIPSEVFPRETMKLPKNIKLADPEFHLPRPVDLLIGSGATLSLFSVGQINLSKEGHDLYLQKTRLGWVVAGGTNSKFPKTTCYLTNLENLITRFWSVEEVASDKPRSREENECEEYYARTVSRDAQGRYIVRLPFRKADKRLGESRSVALKRLIALERKLDADVNLKQEYTRVIEEYLELKHMSRVEDASDDGYYMPHHAVIKKSSDTTKVRVVFDASAKTRNGISLNDTLLTGPIIQNKLISHLIRFRAYRYVISADIEKMFCQILVHEEDRRYQRILWRRDNEIETLQLNTLTFGVASSPFLAIRTVHQLADDERLAFPEAASILKSHLYVDDLLTGAGTIDESRKIRNNIISLLARGGFTIRQWASNDDRIIKDLSSNALHANFILNRDTNLKTLGVVWDTREDKIYYSAHPFKNGERVTKRNILSEIAKIFDPIGLLGPIVMYAKRVMQNVWRCGLQWDESIPQDVHTDWSEFAQQWKLIDRIPFDRKLLDNDPHDIQFHGFSDASNVGYGACLYVRSRGKRGEITIRLLCAKSRVAPLKTITIPRLELCGALLLAQLYREASEALEIIPSKTVFWCDSSTVLHWLETSPHLLKTYVANRVVAVRELTGDHAWRHVRSEDNPADAISRGQLPRDFLQNRLWHTGPLWLTKDEREWPNEVMPIKELLELKKNTCLTTTHSEIGMFEKYSSYSKLLRIVAYCLRFRRANKHTGSLTAAEMNEAEIRIVKNLQAVRFPDEIKKLRDKTPFGKITIANLNPFLDEHGLIRVGGRLQMSTITFAQKHPILLPNRHWLTDRIIREIHENYYHTGILNTLYNLRQRFWLPDGRNQVRKVVRTCTRCARFDASTIEYKMGNLPAVRVREATPFVNTGIDYCGPFFVKEKKFRNRNRVKVYVCIFVCMAIKAVHLEVVSDLTSDGFLAALRRFIARRGLPENIYSDNGTNFIGANNRLKEMYALFNSEEHKDVVSRFASTHQVAWHFIPPLAPHFGGLWESVVKLFKHHLRRVVEDSLFTYEELSTFVTEVEGILNSRPITTISSDPNDMLVLSPAHYLIGRPITALPEGDLSSTPANRLSTWQHITKVRQDFWARWYLEYLNELQI